MRTDLTDITLLLDRSGSMNMVRDDTIGGVNTFVADQAKSPGSALFTLVQFDNEYECVYAGRPVAEAPLLDQATFVPRGSTSLYDAICRAMTDTGMRLDAIPEADRPGMVIFAIMTDGCENSSQSKTIHDVNAMISEQRDKYNWQIVFLAANQDAIAAASKMGINPGLAMSYAHSRSGVKNAMAATSANIISARGMMYSTGDAQAARKHVAYTVSQRRTQDEEIDRVRRSTK